MGNAKRITASTLGIYAGLLGGTHGLFEVLQGNTPSDGVMINAIGAPCQADVVWHACLPALTLMPSFLLAGALTIALALAVLICAAVFVGRRYGGLALIALSILMLLAGGGFVPAFVGIVAGSGINAPPEWWRRWFSGAIGRLLAQAWPWILAIFVAWSLGGWIVGRFFNQVMMRFSFVLFFFFDLGLPVLATVTAFARDVEE